MPASATDRPAPGVAVPTAVGVMVAAVVAALAAVGLVVSLTGDRLPTGPALPPPAAPVATVSYDPTTRLARFDTVTVRMPATPYECPSAPGSALPLLSSAVVCSAVVHADYEGGSDWSATAGFGSVPEALVGSTAEDTAQAFFQQLRRQGFGSHQTSLAGFATEEADLAGHPVGVASGDVHYDVDHVPSSYDRVLVVALPTEDGGYVAYFSSRPDDSPRSVLDPLQASIDSLRVG